ncbi:MAG: hypothetical protein JKY56_01400 [Kofleriaceae bacterium]|nr:hypothetical protein [Kofleriaceae bacterium]
MKLERLDEEQGELAPASLQICKPIYVNSAADTLEDVWGTLDEFQVEFTPLLPAPQRLALARSTSVLPAQAMECSDSTYPRTMDINIAGRVRIPMETWQLLELQAGLLPFLTGLKIHVVAGGLQ